VNFNNTVIIMTSNLGAHALAEDKSEGEVSGAARDAVMEAIRAHFRPEFLNRVDEIVFFKRLGREEIDRIVGVQLKRLEKILADRRITISLTEEAKHWLAERGYDPVYGARPLKRVIQKELQDPLARRILEGRIKDGDDVKVTVEGAALALNGVPAEMKRGGLN
jgi:ATP-dependent Clp protease ATP-binding subunit ClpB